MQRIDFHYELPFSLDEESVYKSWIVTVIESEEYKAGSISYIFCTDEYLLDLHKKYLNKEDLTDIITFDYVNERTVSGDIFISIDRVKENALTFEENFQKELLRVMSHGLLHMMGYGDKGPEELEIMRAKEEEKIKLFHVER